METERLESNKRAVRRLYEECINQARVELYPELIAKEYVGPNGESGPSGFRDTVEAMRAGVPDIRFTVDDLVAEDDKVAIRWTWTGTQTGTLRGFPASNARVTNTGIAVYRLSDGKITGSWLETDRLGVLQQIGVIPKLRPTPPQADAHR
ncbi:MAG TPA: ester cyclase [Polyangiaceae bacterium]|nr:ester cyclase [Polyangiaceae bacterium]